MKRYGEMNEGAKKLELERDILKEKNAMLKEQNAALLSALEEIAEGAWAHSD
jgi:hypothetical protein